MNIIINNNNNNKNKFVLLIYQKITNNINHTIIF